jgi:hypothetical protein
VAKSTGRKQALHLRFSTSDLFPRDFWPKDRMRKPLTTSLPSAHCGELGWYTLLPRSVIRELPKNAPLRLRAAKEAKKQHKESHVLQRKERWAKRTCRDSTGQSPTSMYVVQPRPILKPTSSLLQSNHSPGPSVMPHTHTHTSRRPRTDGEVMAGMMFAGLSGQLPRENPVELVD